MSPSLTTRIPACFLILFTMSGHEDIYATPLLDQVTLAPIVEGSVFDYDADGTPDALDSNFTVVWNPLIEIRGILEFDIRALGRITGGLLEVTPIGFSYPPGTLVQPVHLFGFTGDGLLGAGDFWSGLYLTSVLVPIRSMEPIVFDVSGFITSLTGDYAGFGFRLARPSGEVNFGDSGFPPSARLTVSVIQIGEPESVWIFLAGMAILWSRRYGPLRPNRHPRHRKPAVRVAPGAG